MKSSRIGKFKNLPYTVDEARAAAKSLPDRYDYERNLMLWLCDRVVRLRREQNNEKVHI